MTEDWRAAHAEAERKLAERVRSICAAKPSLIEMTTVVAREVAIPDVRRLAMNSLARPIEQVELDLPAVRAWNSLMPGHTPPAERLEADAERLGCESAFAQLLAEAVSHQAPAVWEAAERVGLTGFADDMETRRQAADALAEIVVSLSFRGKLVPVMCEATRCASTGEYVHFALWGWQPEITDQNGNLIALAQDEEGDDLRI